MPANREDAGREGCALRGRVALRISQAQGALEADEMPDTLQI